MRTNQDITKLALRAEINDVLTRHTQASSDLTSAQQRIVDHASRVGSKHKKHNAIARDQTPPAPARANPAPPVDATPRSTNGASARLVDAADITARQSLFLCVGLTGFEPATT